MFIDLAAFILDWRLSHACWYPPEADMRDYLIAQGWKTKPSRAKPNGGEITIRTVQEMMATMVDGDNVFPPANLDRIAVNMDNVALEGTEIATVHINPSDWAEFCEEVRDGWKPSWADRTLNEADDAARIERLNALLRRS